MTTSEQAALLAKHKSRYDSWINTKKCVSCNVLFPCDVHKMAELKDAEIAGAVAEAVERIVEALTDAIKDNARANALEPIDVYDAIDILLSRDWSKGAGE